MLIESSEFDEKRGNVGPQVAQALLMSHGSLPISFIEKPKNTISLKILNKVY